MVELAGVRGEQIGGSVAMGSAEAGEVALSGIERLWGGHWGELGLAGASVPVSNVEGVWKFERLLHGRVGCCDGVV